MYNEQKTERGSYHRADRNLALKNREDELQLNVNELEAKKTELQKTTAELQQHLAELQEIPIKQEDIISTNDVFIPSPNRVFNYYRSENKTLHYPPQVESSSRAIIFDTKDLF
jgi:ribosomal protein S4